MFRIKKMEGILVHAFCLGKDDELLQSYFDEGRIIKNDNEKYVINMNEGKGSEICESGSYIIIDKEDNLYPTDPLYFKTTHKRKRDHEYIQISKQFWAWMHGEPDSEEIDFLKNYKKLVVNKNSISEYYSAPLWGTVKTADRDSILIFYNVQRDDEGVITDIDYNFVSRDEFYNVYRIITKPEGETDTDILIVTLSLIKSGNFKKESYANDEGPIEGCFTNEAPTKYLIRKLYNQRYTFFSKIIILASQECMEDRITIDGTCIQKMTTLEYYKNMALHYMRELNPTIYADQFPTKELADYLFSVVNIADKKVGTDLMKVFRNKVINPWSANVYMDFTGGLRKESLIGMMVMRCLEAAGYSVRSVIYSYHRRNVNDENDVNQIIDMTGIYRMYDSVIAKSMLEDKAYSGIREGKQLILKRQGMDYFSPDEYGGTEDDVSDFAKVYEGTKPFIFLSYAHKDMLLAQSFLKNLHKRGVNRIWYDQGIHIGEKWKAVLKDRSEQCEFFIALITPTYLESEWCMNELIHICSNRSNKKMLMVYCGTTAKDLILLSEEQRERVEAFQQIFRNEYTESSFYSKILSKEEIQKYYSKTGDKSNEIFINLSNHPSKEWDDLQRTEAEAYGKIIDIPFPRIDPKITEHAMNSLVQRHVEKVLSYGRPVVMVQGEFVFTYRIVNILREKGCLVLAGRSDRIVKEVRNPEGQKEKISSFVFSGFAEY